MRVFTAAFLFLAALTTDSSAKLLTRYNVGEWSVGIFASDQTSKFSSCLATLTLKSGASVHFIVTKSMNWSLGFSHADWNLAVGRQIDVGYRIDDGKVRVAQGKALTRKAININLPDEVELFNEFRRGQTLFITAGKGVVKLTLTDTSKMLSSLLSCAKQHREPNTLAAAPNSLAAPRQEPAPAKALITPENRVEAITVGTNVLTAAGIAGFQFVTQSELAEKFKSHDAVWKAGAMLGSVRVLAGGRQMSLAQMRSGLVATDSASCNGKFASGVMPVADEREGAVTIFTVCDDKAGWSANYILVPRGAGGHYLFSVYGDRDKAEELMKSTGSLREATFRVIK